MKCGWLIVLCLASCALAGCGAERESLYEHDHDLPAHWPHDLVDASQKISERLLRLSAEPTAAQAHSELCELVEWIPEVAADSELPEEHWLPIYDLCEAMRDHLQDPAIGPLDISEDFDRLRGLLEQAAVEVTKYAVDAPGSPQPVSLTGEAS